jgi:dienelactone hydrolase
MAAIERCDYPTVSLGGIEVCLFGAEANAGAPVVFVTHGRTGSMPDNFARCRDLAARGFIAVGVEQRNHGRRLIDARCNEGWGLHAPADMYGILLGTAMDVSLLMDLLPARLGISTERAGMTGVSLGGHATLLAMSLDERLRGGAALIGAGDFRRLMELRAQANQCPAEDFEKHFPPALDAAVRKFDPISHPERFADRPLLIVNGETDTLVPAECSRRLESALRPFYRRPELLKLSIYPNVGHTVTPAMWQESLDWLARRLPA